MQYTRWSEFVLGVLFWGMLLVCYWVYAPGLYGAAILDDAVNLRHLQSLEESGSYLFDVVVGNSSGPLGRPLSMLSFVGSWMAGAGDIQILKYHNLLLHLLNACVVFALGLRLCPYLFQRSGAGVPLLIVALWLFSPLHVSTVLYVVQRMASLAALLVFVALYLYCLGRQKMLAGRNGWRLLVLAQLVAVAGCFAKESALVFWLLQALLEFSWFRGKDTDAGTVRLLRRIYLVMGLLGIVLAIFWLYRHGWLVSAYARRDFTLYERLLSETRILWRAVWSFVWPFQPGYGVYHDDIVVSKGLLDPRGTLLAALGWLLACTLAVLGIVRGTVLPVAFGILFFCLAHSLESTVLPLELYFEHRNYVAVFGISVLMVGLATLIGRRVPVLKTSIAAALWLIVGGALIATGQRAAIWSKPEMLTLVHVQEHPGSERANMEMATLLARAGDPLRAEDYARKAFYLAHLNSTTEALRTLTLYCMADRAADESYFEQLRANLEELRDTRANEALAVLVDTAQNVGCVDARTNRIGEALAITLRGDAPVLPPRFYALMAIYENSISEFQRGDRYAEKWLQREPDNGKALLMRLYFRLQLHDQPMAEQFRQKLRELERAGRLTREQVEDLRMFESFLNPSELAANRGNLQ